jgi:hypothetical protein
MSEQAGRIDLNLEFTFAAAVNRDLRDAGHRKQPRAKRPISEGPEIHRGARFRCQTDRHDSAGSRGQRRHDRRRHALRHLPGDLEQPLSNNLARLIDLSAIGKSNRHDRETLDRARTNRFEPGGSDQRIFDPLRDECFHLFGRKSRRLGLNGYLWRCELGKNAQTCMLSGVQPIEHSEAGERDHDAAQTEGEFNDRVKHPNLGNPWSD